MSWIRQPTETLFAAKPETRAAIIRMRGEVPDDAKQIRDLLEASFPGDGEAILVEKLRQSGELVLSLIAEDEGVVIGYIAFSRIVVEGGEAPFGAVALAPLAVYPDYQQHGVATRLVTEAHACLAAHGETLSVVLGETTFYGRFGYSNRRVAGFDCEYQSPYLMALSFGLAPSGGKLIYPTAFAALG